LIGMTGLTWISALSLMVAVPSASPRPAQDTGAYTVAHEDRVAQEGPHAAPSAPQAKTPQSVRHQKKAARLACKDVTMRRDRADRIGCDVHGESKE
jgi:hypothetical protein